MEQRRCPSKAIRPSSGGYQGEAQANVAGGRLDESRTWREARLWLLAAIGVALLLTSTDSGHSSVSGPAAFIADALHITGAAIWIGGLTLVLALSPFTIHGAAGEWQLSRLDAARADSAAALTVDGEMKLVVGEGPEAQQREPRRIGEALRIDNDSVLKLQLEGGSR